MAEGAIEGVAADYRVDAPHATEFRYSRFHSAPAEDPEWSPAASALSGGAGAAERE
jgi:hypothetical protein